MTAHIPRHSRNRLIFNQLVLIVFMYVSKYRVPLIECISSKQFLDWNIITRSEHNVTDYVCMYVTLRSFYLYHRNHPLKLCININIGHAVILPFHDFHLRGQTIVAYIKIWHKTSSFICISRSIFGN